MAIRPIHEKGNVNQIPMICELSGTLWQSLNIRIASWTKLKNPNPVRVNVEIQLSARM